MRSKWQNLDDREMVLRILAQFLGSLTFYHVFVVSLWDIGLTSIHEQRLVHHHRQVDKCCFVREEAIVLIHLYLTF